MSESNLSDKIKQISYDWDDEAYNIPDNNEYLNIKHVREAVQKLIKSMCIVKDDGMPCKTCPACHFIKEIFGPQLVGT